MSKSDRNKDNEIKENIVEQGEYISENGMTVRYTVNLVDESTLTPRQLQGMDEISKLYRDCFLKAIEEAKRKQSE